MWKSVVSGTLLHQCYLSTSFPSWGGHATHAMETGTNQTFSGKHLDLIAQEINQVINYVIYRGWCKKY